ncbi:mitochondrial 50S ribosomal protein L3 [Laetiporus sulphureus 93-53]|uniref:Large ribosomal subunit protein uL3m n=1 Tax=Laetiporus sulphureus 93-53 TaxID=1314785 RepID=A0A165G0G4_9APHY|nr:mitochondrial 50S ribosomal protein L3 [Laetiporus sulphureus 93-53]KZT09663.1 mitochondrial 50S ribosomal protein L3 [Laetiporus sulphureus 93-53]
MLRLWASRQCPRISSCRTLHSTIASNASASTEQKPQTEARWTPFSVRTGVIARKRGMMSMWDDHGARFPVTVLQLENCQVTANIKNVKKDKTEYHAVQVGASDKREKTTTRQMLGHFNKAGVPPKQIVKEFPVTPDAHLPVGTTLSAIHFVPGQNVDVTANSVGKGFQGVMKRWGYHGQSASHGTSLAHRSAGATGAHQDPGRVWPGKKMAGHMGNRRVTKQNLSVVRVDSALDLIFVKGNVPGVDDAQVMLRDSKKMVQKARVAHAKGVEEKILPKGVDALPFPAGTKEMTQHLPPVIEAPTHHRSPFLPYV